MIGGNSHGSGLVVDPAPPSHAGMRGAKCSESWESSGSPDSALSNMISGQSGPAGRPASDTWAPEMLRKIALLQAGGWGCKDFLHLMQNYFQSEMLELCADYEGHAK